jgi:hypothetical protein
MLRYFIKFNRDNIYIDSRYKYTQINTIYKARIKNNTYNNCIYLKAAILNVDTVFGYFSLPNLIDPRK